MLITVIIKQPMAHWRNQSRNFLKYLETKYNDPKPMECAKVVLRGKLIVIYTIKGFGIVNKAEVDVFLELSCLFDDQMDVGNFISGRSEEHTSELQSLQ